MIDAFGNEGRLARTTPAYQVGKEPSLNESRICAVLQLALRTTKASVPAPALAPAHWWWRAAPVAAQVADRALRIRFSRLSDSSAICSPTNSAISARSSRARAATT
jgi:hypothetical protein